MENIKKQGSNNITIFIGFALFLLSIIRYNIVLDVLIIGLLFLSSYSIGSIIKINGTSIQKVITQTAIGLGILGILIYFNLLIGIGSKSLYVILLIAPIVINRDKLKHFFLLEKNNIKSFIDKYQWMLLLALIIFIGYLICGSAPISKYDALTKHLPITIYASNNGGWYTNPVEGFIYGEGMLLQYTYSTLFYTLGAFKALSLFNVFLIFAVFAIIVEICHNIYSKTNWWLLMGVFFTTPLFFEFSTIYYIDILPIFFSLILLTSITNLDEKQIWDNIPTMAFLAGCALFSKLTSAYSILILGLIAIIFCIRYALKQKYLLGIIKKFLLCIITFILPFITSLVVSWYYTGNPLFYHFNSLFKSPYYPIYSSTPPFGTAKLSLSIDTLINIVFHTSRNIEMRDGGLGLFLLLIITIPLAILIEKKFKLFIWSIVPFILFAVSCLFTYNLRYLMVIFMLFLAIIIISTSIILNRLPIITRRVLLIVLGGLLILPNLVYLYKCYDLKSKMRPDSSLTLNLNNSVLDQVGKDKKVLSLNDPFKGDFEGFFSALMHHNAYSLMRLSSGEIDWESYICSFDYILYKKGASFDIADGKMIFNNLLNQGHNSSLIEIFDESTSHILYKVKKQLILPEVIVQDNYSDALPSRTSKPIITRIENDWDYYIINQDVENPSTEPIVMRFQINWHKGDGTFIGTDITTYELNTGRDTFTSYTIPKNEDAAYGIVYFTSHEDQEVLIHGYKVEGYKEKDNFIDIETKKYYLRELLK